MDGVLRSEYEEARATRVMRGIPRFGHSAEFASAFGTKEEQSDYIWGLLFAGIFVLCFFLLWTILIPIFMCLGQRKFGFLSGSAFKVPYGSKRPMIIRTTFIIATITLVIFTVLLVSEGLTELEAGIGTLYRNSQTVNQIIDGVSSLTDSVDNTGKVVISLRDATLSLLNANTEFCPGGNLTAETGTDYDAIIENATTFLNGLGNFSQAKIADLQEALDAASNSGDDIEQTANNIQFKDWQSLIFIVPCSVFSFVLLGGVLLAWLDRSFKWLTSLIKWVVFPLFFIWIIICWAVCGAFAIGASANADFCSGGLDNTPESSIMNIMAYNGFTEDDLIVRVIQFYAYQCVTRDSPFGFIEAFASELMDAKDSVARFVDAITNTTIDTIVQICGQSDYQVIADLVQNLKLTLDQLVADFVRALALVSCDTIVPLYTSTFHSGTCENTVKGATWTFSALLVMAVMGLLMITFRSSWHPTEFVEEDKFVSAPMEYVEEYEVANEPHQAEQSAQDAEMSWLKDAQNTGVPVVTGVAAGAAIDEAMNDENGRPFNESGGEDAIKAFVENGGEDPTKAFDDSNWLEVPPTAPAPPTAPNY